MNAIIDFIQLAVLVVLTFAFGYFSCELRCAKIMEKVCDWWETRIDDSSFDYIDGINDTMDKIREFWYRKGE